MHIIGNKNIINFLNKSFESNTLPHAFIFSGPKNLGKRSTALWLTCKLLQVEEKNLSTHPDFIELNDEGIIKKESIDKIIERLKFTAFNGGYKVLIVNDAHSMNSASANSFLKTLEEPSKKTIIILLTSRIGKVLPTIISRSSVLHFNLVSRDEICKLLVEKYNISDPKKYATISNGRPGKAISMLMDKKWGEEIGENFRQFTELFSGTYNKRFKVVKAILPDKESKQHLIKKIDFWLEIIRDIIYLKYKLDDNVAHKASVVTLNKLSLKYSAREVAVLANRLIKMKNYLSNNINPTLMLENLII